MIKLVPFTEEEFQPYYDWLVRDYASDFEQTGVAPDRALEKAKADIDGSLPHGLQSERQHLFSVQDTDTEQKVGVVWYAVQGQQESKSLFLMDIVIYPEFRGKGYGKQSMLALEDQAKEQGATKIGLHVFGHNHAARELYKKLGYTETNVQMVKTL